MFPGRHLPLEGREEHRDPTDGCVSLKEILPVSRGNSPPTHLISAQPLAAAPVEATQPAAGFRTPHRLNVQRPTCPRCGLTVPGDGLDHISKGWSPPQSSGSPEHHAGGAGGNHIKSSKRSKGGVPGSPHSADAPADGCFPLLLACLWCQGSALLLGLLEACSSCLQGVCSSCCRACGRCCAAAQEAPVEELGCHAHCHSVLFQSCGEPCCESAECLEFCLECCQICHRS